MVTIDSNACNVLKDIHEKLQLIRVDMKNMSTQMNNLFKRVESTKNLQVKQSSKSGYYNDNYRNCQWAVPSKNHQHDHHQGHNDIDDPNNGEHSNNYR